MAFYEISETKKLQVAYDMGRAYMPYFPLQQY